MIRKADSLKFHCELGNWFKVTHTLCTHTMALVQDYNHEEFGSPSLNNSWVMIRKVNLNKVVLLPWKLGEANPYTFSS